MAISINQEPTFPNVVYTNLLYAVYSPSSSNAQYQYVMDVYLSGSANRLTRIKQFPNPQGSAIFDTSRVMADYSEYDTFLFDSSYAGFEPLIQSQNQFEIKFGEEYGTSISSSVVLYDGNGNVGDPAVTGEIADVFMGTVDPNNGLSYNWPDSGSVRWLTDRPDGVERYQDSAPDGDAIWLTAYNGSDVAVQIYGNGTTPIGSPVPANDIRYIPIYRQAYASFSSWTFGTDTIAIPPTTVSCNYDRINFVFINNYGVWDSYGFNLPVSHRTSIKRSSITTPFVDYSSGVSQYNESRRGKSYYNTSYEDSYEVTTPYISQAEAQWLSQLLESPEVYIQNYVSDPEALQRSGMTPIVLTNSSYTHNTNKRGQKAFQYNIEYQLANKRQTR